jgi:hypothetical protein
VVLEEGARLPEGAAVEVRMVEAAGARQAAFARVLDNPVRRPVGIDAIIEEEKAEREAAD